MSTKPNHEALALLEIDSMPRAIRAQDAALKRAPITVLACAPVSPGKAILIFTGDVASVEESLADADMVAGSGRIDRMFLPGVHQGVVAAVVGERHPQACQALAILELETAASALLSADAALKATDVHIGRLHLATGFGGRAYFTLRGTQYDIEAAVDAARHLVGERLLEDAIIPAPHDELEEAAFVRPWDLDPAN